MFRFIILIVLIFGVWYVVSSAPYTAPTTPFAMPVTPVTSTPEPTPLPSKPVAIVFGAGLASYDAPSLVLQDRLDTAYQLYEDGKVDELLLSGDSTLKSHDEVGVMKKYLLKKGILESKLSVDTQGIDTYTTCLHAKNDFHLVYVMLVTQEFHISRAQYLCNGVGLTVDTAIADKREYDPANIEREKKAMTKAWLQLNTGIDAKQLDELEKIVE